jgi:hypothetical protein
MTPKVSFKFSCPGCSSKPFVNEQAGLKHTYYWFPFEQKLCSDFVCKFASNCGLKFPPFASPKPGKNCISLKRFPYMLDINPGLSGTTTTKQQNIN